VSDELVPTLAAALEAAADPERAAVRAQALLGSLPPIPVADRLVAVRGAMAEAGCEALLVTHLVNVRWLTGFSGSAALVLVLPDEVVFTTDGRYGEQSAHQLAEAGVGAVRTVAGAEGQKEAVVTAAHGIGRIGLEADAVTWSQQRRYAESWFPAAELVATHALVDALRVVKHPGEVARIEAACAVADAALAQVRHRLGEEPTEAEFGLELDTAMRRLGAEGTTFETIVAAGPNGAMPHHRPGPRRIVDGDLVVIDFGALVDGYCSDMTRTIMVGEPTATQARMLEVVGAAQQAGVEAVQAGAVASAVDRACREVIEEAGWGDAFVHSTGHGVGLEIHEEPRVAATVDATLADGAVVTVEPGVYLPDHGGVRIEDTVVVLKDGCRPLTLAPKSTAVA
jgi:Xaa-Pro aminopeptidase